MYKMLKFLISDSKIVIKYKQCFFMNMYFNIKLKKYLIKQCLLIENNQFNDRHRRHKIKFSSFK